MSFLLRSQHADGSWGGPGGYGLVPTLSAVDALLSVHPQHPAALQGLDPIVFFERAWVIAALDVPIPAAVSAPLLNALGEAGAPAGPGLPADADDTAAVLCALAKIGRPASTDSLRRYEEDDYYFICFPGERTPSTSTNAHILEALPGERKIADWLLDQQHSDGSWTDKWHASPYYATACCAQALGGSDKAARWVLDTQRDDGSWGRWQGTVEETAYAVRILLGSTFDTAEAIERGCDFLLTHEGEHPPLWHDKDLYAPLAVIEATRLGALHAAGRR